MIRKNKKGSKDMVKSIYSLVLSDEVVEMVDIMAYKKGMNRSNFINSVLAEYVGYETPKKKIDDIFNIIDELILGDTRMRLENRKRDSRFEIVSALNYKYSPRITYGVELTFEKQSLGQIVISYRTQKDELCNLIDSFFSKFISLEKEYFGEENITYLVKDGKLIRTLRPKTVNSVNELSSDIMAYINTVNGLLNHYILENILIRDNNLRVRFLSSADKLKI